MLFRSDFLGIGSSQYSHTQENPFTYEERTEMITNTLNNHNINNFTITSIPDLHDPPNWVKHVIDHTPNFDIVITNNDFTKQLFIEKKYTVKSTPIINREEYSGREIRHRITNNLPWQQLVPKEVYSYIRQLKGEERIQKKKPYKIT